MPNGTVLLNGIGVVEDEWAAEGIPVGRNGEAAKDQGWQQTSHRIVGKCVQGRGSNLNRQNVANIPRGRVHHQALFALRVSVNESASGRRLQGQLTLSILQRMVQRSQSIGCRRGI